MKKLKLWSMMMLAAMTMSVMTSCGGDDGGDAGNKPVNPDNPDPNAIISFKDNKVAMICLANFDINKDNQLSYGEAATVRSLKGVFAGEPITLFDELKYFTGLSEISDEAFKNCSSLTSVTIPNGVSIGKNAFYGCSKLSTITIPKGLTSIGNSAFSGCSGLTSITIPNSVTSIGEWAFYGCSKLPTITIPNSVTSIEGYAFSGCSGLTSITIPNSVTYIGNSTFSHCSGLTSITIPNSVTYIGNGAFFGCSGLTSIVSQIVNPFVIYGIDSSIYQNATLYVPKGTIDKYKTTSGWSQFKNIVEQ